MTDFLQAFKGKMAPFLVRNFWPVAGAGVHLAFDGAVQRQVSQTQLKVLLLCVYRYKNASFVAAHLEEAKRQGWEVRLWALDKVHPVLEACSVGAGKGLRMPLLNKLAEGKNLSGFDWIVVMDDDFQFVRGTMSLFLALAGRAGLALAQPAHDVDSQRTFWFFSLYKPVSVARLTTFIEIGPIFAIHHDWVERLLPFSGGAGMGWGLDIEWSDLRTEGARLGIVDWVTLRHLQPVGKNYDNSPEDERLWQLLRGRGFHSLRDFMKTEAVWRPWQARPPWLD